MAYGLYLYKNVTTKGNRVVRLEIWSKDYTGSSAEIEAMGASPFAMSIDNSGGGVEEPLIKTNLNIVIKDTNQVDYDLFFTPDATKFKVIIKISGVDYWVGYLTPDSYSESLSYRSDIVLTARDNLGMLSEIKYERAGKRATMRTLLNEAMALISFGNTLEYRQKKTSGTLNILDAYIRCDRFIGKTWADVVQTILHDCGLQMRFVGAAKYAIYDIGEIVNLGTTISTQTFKFIEESGQREIIPAARTITLNQDYGSVDNSYDGVLADSEYSFRAARSVSQPVTKDISTPQVFTINYYDPFSIVWSGAGGSMGIVNPNEWNEAPSTIMLTGDLYTFTNYRPAIYYSQIMPITAGNVEVKFQVSNLVKYPATSGSDYVWKDYFFEYIKDPSSALVEWFGAKYQVKFRCNIFLQGATKTYIMRERWEEYIDEGPTATAKYLTFVLPSGGNAGEFPNLWEYNAKDEELKFNIQTIPEDGTLRIAFYPYELIGQFVQMYPSVEPQDIKDNIPLTYPILVKNISIKYPAFEVGGLESSAVINSAHNVAYNIDLELGQVPQGIGDSATMYGGLFNTGVNFYKALGNFFVTAGTEYHLSELIGREIANIYKEQREKLSGTIITDVNFSAMPSFGKTFTDGVKYYAINSGTLDFISEQMQVEMIEVEPYLYEDFTFIEATIESGGGSSMGAGEKTFVQWSAAGNAKRIYQLDTASEADQGGSYVMIDKSGLSAAKKVPISSLLVDAYTKTESDSRFASIDGDLTQDFSAKKLTTATLLLPQTAPILASGEAAIYSLDSGFSGELPSGAGSVTSIGLTVPTGLQVKKDEGGTFAQTATITESGTFILQITNGYALPTTIKQSEWDNAYTLRHNAVTLGTANGLSLSTQVLSLGLASASANGALSSTDWNTFNGKAPATGGSGYIQNQIASAQTANYWISGKAKMGTLILPQSAPSLVSGEIGLYALESGFSGELPSGAGSVTSISMVVPTGLSVTPATITESGTFTISYASGYSIPTNTKQSEWNSAYTLRHNAVTLGTANGLSLSTQILSLALATTTTSGAMSSSDKTKLDGIAANANNYTLPLAANGTRGGIQIGFTATGASLPLLLSSEKAYVTLTKSAVENVLTGAITSHTHAYLSDSDSRIAEWTSAYNDKINSATFTASTLTLTQQDGGTVAVSIPTFNQNTTGSAATLTTPRAINVSVSGVSGTAQNFNGSAAITIPVTLTTLTRGNYLTGSNYNGGTATTWAVDATTTATANKVVARDANADIFVRDVNASRKVKGATLILPQSAPTLDSGEVGIYSLDSGFSGELPSGSGSVTSIALTMPTGFSVSGSPITESGTFGVTFASGYFLPTTTQFATKADVSLIGAANGIAPLDSGGKVALQYLPSTLLKYMGVWNASTNTPTLLATDTNRKGQVWNVSVAGTQFGIAFKLGDWLIYNDSGVAEKSDNSDDVVSVNGYTGAVTLKTSDIAEQTNLYYTDARVKTYADTLYSILGHVHDDRYYTETEVANFFSGTVAIAGYNKSNWDTAYANRYYRTGVILSEADVLSSTANAGNAQGSYIVQHTGYSSHLMTFQAGGSANYFQLWKNNFGNYGDLKFRTSTDSNLSTSWQTIYHSGNLLNIGTTALSARTALGLGSAALKSDTYFALLAGSISQPFSASKLTSTTLLLPQSAPTLSSGEMAIYGLESGFSGELPSGAGSVTSISMVVPTGLSVTPVTITESGTFTISYASGYSIPTNTKQSEWDSAYTLRHNAVTLGTANGLSLSTQILSLALATTTTSGAMSSSDKTKLDGIAANANNYTLPTATNLVLGGVKIGSNITITDGVISVAAPYTLPTATTSVLGGVKIGTNVTITDGVISVHNPITLGTANGLSLSTQVLSLGLASTSTNGALSSTDWNTFNNKQAKLIGTGASSLVRVNTLGTITYDDNTYLTGNQTITLSGIITGSGTTAITTAIADGALSIAKTSGLQTALDAKMATASYPDLVAIEALSGTSGLLKKTAANTWVLDTNTYLTAITKAQVEAVLTGAITSHNHNGTYALISGATTQDFQVKALTMNGALSGATDITANGTISGSTLAITSQAGGSHLSFARPTYSYVTAAGSLNFIAGGKAVALTNTDFQISAAGNVAIGGYYDRTEKLSVNGTTYFNGASTINGALAISGALSGATTISASGIVSLTNTTQSTAYTNGALVLSGGLGIAKDLYSNGLIKASKYRFNAGSYEIGIYNSRFSFTGEGVSTAIGANMGSLLISDSWSDSNNVPTNGIYSKGQIRSATSIKIGANWEAIPNGTSGALDFNNSGTKASLSTTGVFTMTENINTNLRIPKVAPTSPTSGQYYFYIVE